MLFTINGHTYTDVGLYVITYKNNEESFDSLKFPQPIRLKSSSRILQLDLLGFKLITL